jgi:hypothetical protein
MTNRAALTDPLTTEAAAVALYRAAARATLAPSIHNSQPWRFIIRPDRLELYADPGRAVPVIDPHGRQRALSCGAALFGVRASLAAAGVGVEVTLVPDPVNQPNLMASVTLAGDTATWELDGRRLDAAADRRHSNRREFADGSVPDDVMDILREGAAREGAELHHVVDLEDRVMLATLVQGADEVQNADSAYRAELRAWTTDDPARTDGVPVGAVPHTTTGQHHDDLPIRDFDTVGKGQLPAQTGSTLYQTLAIISTAGDEVRDWLAAGQGLYRVLLELTDAGYVASLFSQVCEVASTRAELRADLRLLANPQILLRAGHAAPTPPVPRRLLGDVISTIASYGGSI